MNQLLQETAEVRRKMRTQNEHYESVLREQKSKVRKISEENIDFLSKKKKSEETATELKEKLKEESIQKKELNV